MEVVGNKIILDAGESIIVEVKQQDIQPEPQPVTGKLSF